MREVVLDTETTGLSPATGDRVVEIGCVEVINFLPTGRTFQVYLDPEMSMPYGALQIHGLTDEFLRGKPKFAEIAGDFVAFIEGAQIIAHNADFDIGFLNAELALAGRPFITSRVLDTVRLARKKYPGAQNSLDALCRRFNIDTSAREKHGALLDADLLAQVYLEIVGGRQPGLTLAATPTAADQMAGPANGQTAAGPLRAPREHRPSDDELIAHAAFVKTLNEPVWAW